MIFWEIFLELLLMLSPYLIWYFRDIFQYFCYKFYLQLETLHKGFEFLVRMLNGQNSQLYSFWMFKFS